MKSIFTVGIILLSCPFTGTAASTTEAKPNIIVVMAFGDIYQVHTKRIYERVK